MATFRMWRGKYRAEVHVNGVRESRTFLANEKTKAKLWANSREAELRGGEVATHRYKLRDLLERYAKEESPKKRGGAWEQKRITAWLSQPWSDVMLSRCTPDYFASWRDDRLKSDSRYGRPVSPSTVRREMTLLSAVFTTARREWRLIPYNPLTEVKKPTESPHRERLFTDDEVERLCKAMRYSDDCDFSLVSQRVAAAMLLALETAMRAGELCSLSPRTVFLDKRYARLEQTKNGLARDVPLSSRAIDILSRVDCDLRLKPEQLDANFRKYRDRLGIENLHFHDTRHTAITRIASARTLDVLELARMTGHSNINQLRSYYNESATNIAKRLG